MPWKAHEVATGGGRVGVALVRMVLNVISSEEETDWEHFGSFDDMFGS